MTLEELLKDGLANARVGVGNRWLVWYGEEWVVFEHKYGGAGHNLVLYKGESIEEAIVEILR